MNAVEVRGLTKRFGELQALAGVDLTLATGEVLGLLGPNGAGKSTLVRALVGRIRPDAGEIRLLGRPAEEPGARAALGYVPQEIALYGVLTARQNLALFGRLMGLGGERLERAVDAALAFANLDDRAGDAVEPFSGGMKRRLNLAIGILADPKVLLLDEPTVGVDPQSRERIYGMIVELAERGVAILYTTHYMEEAERLCDRVAVIDHGEVIATGTQEELVRSTVGAGRQIVVHAARPIDGALAATSSRRRDRRRDAAARDGRARRRDSATADRARGRRRRSRRPRAAEPRARERLSPPHRPGAARVIGTLIAAGWRQLSRDRAALALSFVVPIVFFTIFATIFGGSRDAGTRKLRLLLVDEDASERSARFVAALEAESAFAVYRTPRAETGEPPPARYDRASAEAAVRAGDAPVALIVPRGFGERKFSFGPSAGERPRIELLTDSSDPIAAQMAAGLLQKVVFSGLQDLYLEGGIDALDGVALFTPEQRERLGGLLETIRRPHGESEPASAGGAAMAMPIEIETHDLMGEGKKNPLVAFYAAGLGVMFLLFTAAGAGGALIEERESGTLDRLLSTRVTMAQLLAGKLFYLASLGFVQLVVMFVWGWALFDLELPGHLAGFVLMAIPTALVSSAFGLVLAAVCNTRKQLVAMSNLVILSISALGGSMFPRFLMPEALQQASLVMFNAWALEGFLDVFWREHGLVAILPEIAVLLAWTIGLFFVARRLARKWEIV